MSVSIKHATLTGAGANPDVLVDGPKWDAEHTVTGLENVPNVDATNASNLSSGTVPAGRLANSGKPFVLLFSGQSNPELAPVYAWTPNANAQIWNGGREGVTGTAFAALQRATVIFPAKIASDIADNNLTRPVYLINVVQSGTTISHWLSGTGAPDVYATLKREIEAALALIGVARIDAFGWWQGENDALAGSTTYRTDFESLMTRLRAETWFPRETPTLICSLCSIANSGFTNADTLNDTLLSLVSADPDVRRYLNSNILTGATYWDAAIPGHMTGQGYFSAGALAAHTLLNGWGRGSPFNIMVDPVTGKVNVGTYGAPDSLLTINNNTGSSAALPFQADLHLVATDATIGGVLSHVYSGQTLFTGVASGGSRASKSALTSGSAYLALVGQTYDGSAYASNAGLEFLTINAQSGTDHSSRARLRLVPSGSITLTDVMLWGPGVAIGSGAADPGAGNLNLGGGKLQNNGTDPTGTGAYVRATSPALVTPALGTPASGVATNLTGTASSLTAGNATNVGITDDTTTNATMYPTWVTTTTGNLPEKISSTKLTFNPNSGQLSAILFGGSTATAAVDTNSTVLASTGFVIGQAASATPLIDGSAAVGTSTRFARGDHVHPTDTTRAALASPTFTGTPAAPTASPGTNTTQLATTAYADAIAALKANLASPTFTGTPAAPTAAVDTNTTQVATTAMVLAQAASATPLIDGTAAVGTSTRYARGDHVHPTDTTRAALASPTFTGTPAAPTAAVDTNTTQLATTAMVLAQAASATPLIDGSATVGTSTRYARGDHVHPTDTTRAPLASPTFTGVATANSFVPNSSTIPTNGMYLPAANAVGLASNLTLMFEICQAGGLGRSSAFGALLAIPAAAVNGLAIRGTATAGTISVMDFSTSADVQCGSINIDQTAHTATFNSSSDERGKPYRVALDVKVAREVICGLEVVDHDDERNLIQGVGFLAQQAYHVLPRMVTIGDSEEAIDLEKPGLQLWQVDQSKAVPYLVAVVQDLLKRIDALEASR